MSFNSIIDDPFKAFLVAAEGRIALPFAKRALAAKDIPVIGRIRAAKAILLAPAAMALEVRGARQQLSELLTDFRQQSLFKALDFGLQQLAVNDLPTAFRKAFADVNTLEEAFYYDALKSMMADAIPALKDFNNPYDIQSSARMLMRIIPHINECKQDEAMQGVRELLTALKPQVPEQSYKMFVRQLSVVATREQDISALESIVSCAASNLKCGE